jgi:hypothetical protein
VLLSAPTGRLFRVFPDGSVGADPFTVPDGSVLVVTDVDWSTQNGTPATASHIELTIGPAQSPVPVFDSTALIASDGRAGKNEHMTSGIVLAEPPLAVLFSSGSLRALVLRGYLAPKVVRQ